MGLFSNPLGHAGYPPGATGRPTNQPSEVRSATVAEVTAGVLDSVYLSPLTKSIALLSTLEALPVIGLGDGASMIGFYGASPVAKQMQGDIINHVHVGGVDGTIANFTNLSTYSADAHAIRNDIYQLAQGLQGVIAALRNYGLLG